MVLATVITGFSTPVQCRNGLVYRRICFLGQQALFNAVVHQRGEVGTPGSHLANRAIPHLTLSPHY